MTHFWNWVKNDNEGSRTLLLEGVIAEESWFGDEATPEAFRSELMSDINPVTVRIHSPGGDCIAAARIYDMLKEYPAAVTVQIDSLAASAASVVAMAGDRICMSPTALLMIHNPFTAAQGDAEEMRRAGRLLDEVKESIINAYQLKTGLPRAELSRLMNEETWMNAHRAKELGFCDDILYADASDPVQSPQLIFSQRKTNLALLNRLASASLPNEPSVSPAPSRRISVASLQKRLSLINH